MRRFRLTPGALISFGLLLAAGVLGAVREGRGGGEITWFSDLQIAQHAAKAAGKPLFVVFQTSGCVWCQKMDAETLSDPGVIGLLSQGYVCARVDSDLDQQIAARYHILNYPTVLLFSARGGLLRGVTGYVPPQELTATLRPPGVSRSRTHK